MLIQSQTFCFYYSVNQQLEQAKLNVKEQTPVVSVLQPVQVPVDDETSGTKILLIFMIMGVLGSFLTIIFLRKYIALDD